MAKTPNYNAKLLNPVTNEEVPCVLIGSVRYRGNKHTYFRLRQIPASPLLDQMFPELNPDTNLIYHPPRLSKAFNHFPFILIDDTTKRKMAVQLISCSYKGVKHYNVTVKEVLNGLNYAESVEKFAMELEESNGNR